MTTITAKNRMAIFGTAEPGPQKAACTITGRLSKPIPGRLQVYREDATKLWVMTNQPKRTFQDVHTHIDLSKADALDKLAAAGVTFTHLAGRPLTIGTNILLRRIHCKLTQEQLAAKSGIAQTKISQYECGNIGPTVPTLRKLAEALGCEPGELIGD